MFHQYGLVIGADNIFEPVTPLLDEVRTCNAGKRDRYPTLAPFFNARLS